MKQSSRYVFVHCPWFWSGYIVSLTTPYLARFIGWSTFVFLSISVILYSVALWKVYCQYKRDVAFWKMYEQYMKSPRYRIVGLKEKYPD